MSSKVQGIVMDLTESESARYDRQIRVWGADAQAKIKRAKVLICGLQDLNVEVILIQTLKCKYFSLIES